MDKSIIDILVVVFGLGLWIRWLFQAKGTPYKSSIFFTGIFLIITVVAYVVGTSFYAGTALGGLLGLIGIFAFIGFWFFLIKAILEERRFKKQSPHD